MQAYIPVLWNVFGFGMLHSTTIVLHTWKNLTNLSFRATLRPGAPERCAGSDPEGV